MTVPFRRPPEEPAIDYSNLDPHELAAMMDLIEGDAFAALKKDIVKNGIKQRIVLYEGKILDGRNRYRAAQEAGIVLTDANFEVCRGSRDEAEALVISLNFQRRQMNNKQKEAVIRRLIGKYPDDSDRNIARRCGMSHSYVGKVRDEPTLVQKVEELKEANFKRRRL